MLPFRSLEQRVADLERRIQAADGLARNKLDARYTTPLCGRLWLATLNADMSGTAAADLVSLDETDTLKDVTVTDPWDKNSNLTSGAEVVCMEQIDVDGTRYYILLKSEYGVCPYCTTVPDTVSVTFTGWADQAGPNCTNFNSTFTLPWVSICTWEKTFSIGPTGSALITATCVDFGGPDIGWNVTVNDGSCGYNFTWKSGASSAIDCTATRTLTAPGTSAFCPCAPPGIDSTSQIN